MTALRDRVLAGDTIFTVMSPDTEVDKTAPDHIEGFVMSPCLLVESHLWGTTDTLLIGPDAAPTSGGRPVQFYYTDMRNYFCSMVADRFVTPADGHQTVNLGPLGRYKLHEFRATADHRLIFDSATALGTEPLVEALGRGRRLKFALQVASERWLVNRIVHAQQETDGSVIMMAAADPFPQILVNSRANFDQLPPMTQKQGLVANCDAIQAGVSVSTAGWFVGQLGTLVSSPYLALRVFEAL